jgi:protein-S-isoprenylcysteine O-methyltransferase Ste14
MNVVHPWNLVFLAGFIVYVIIRGVFDHRTKRNRKVANRAPSWDRLLLVLVSLGALLLPILYLFTPWLAFADYRLPTFLPWCGLAIMLAALWLFWRSHADLGKNWSVTLEVREGHQLVTNGVYKSIRHPMYAAIFLWDVSQGLLLANWLAGCFALVSFAILYFVRAPREERMMCEFFGDEYRAYIGQTGRLFPRLTPRS